MITVELTERERRLLLAGLNCYKNNAKKRERLSETHEKFVNRTMNKMKK